MSHGGGAFLLTLSIIAGVCLVTLPNKTNANAADNNITSLTNDNTIQWRVVELDGTHAQNVAKLAAVSPSEMYVKYVLQVDWDCPEQLTVSGMNIIWDLHGHTLQFVNSVAMNFGVAYQTQTVEITDSSPTGSGRLLNRSNGLGTCQTYPAKYLLISGGTIRGMITTYLQRVIVIGGTIDGDYAPTPVLDFNNGKIYLAEYITATKDTSGCWHYRADTGNTDYMVTNSTNHLVSGLYNYGFSNVGYLGQQSCLLEKLLAPQCPYLWYQNNLVGAMDGNWFNYLSLFQGQPSI